MSIRTRKKISSKSGPKRLTVIRLPEHVREQLEVRAARESRSLSNAAVACITERLATLAEAA